MNIAKEVKVTFQPSGRSVFAIPGTILIDAAARAGCVIDTPCGGAASCGKCAVKIVSPAPPPASGSETKALSTQKIEHGYRLACSFKVTTDMIVEIPDSALFQSGQKILSSHDSTDMHLDSAVTLHSFACDPDSDRCCSTRETVTRTIPGIDIGETAGKALDLISGHGETWLVSSANRLAKVSSTKPRLTGVAFDIGTTTIVGTLVDLETGREAGLASTVNPQTAFGDDVISRIKKCRDDSDGLKRLSSCIRDAVNRLINELSTSSRIPKEEIFYAVFAGNTAMQQIFAGIDPSSLGEIPFEPAFREALKVTAESIGIDICPEAEIFIFPQIGGFVGGDTVSGILATRLDLVQKPSLMVDVGTNGEIVLAAKGRLLCASVAAGPAFEGARIINGMRASRGAIEKAVFSEGDIQINVIGNAKPSGICGTGLIDAAAELMRLGVIDITGRIQDKSELPDNLPESITRRIVESDMGCDFILADETESATGEAILLYQRDIRELQLANAAIRAGINILLKTAGIKADDLDTVLLAGAFGNFIRRSNARRIGMLPQIPCERIRFVGNTASFGAKKVLLSKQEAQYAGRIQKAAEHIDLSASAEFQDEFGAAMIFPESDLDSDC